ncbi:MAG: hypothetical protein A2W91_10040 [Bacteroidetes bacterium GWF2_38_335]|nr:MAG: hypothetical protein A2W91_10040 [Bacteroidetes bacterium GWF2_38_335]HBS88034.1 DNA-binding response regulator [Bacteroidales bacterium]
MIKAIVVEDQEIFRKGIISILEDIKNVEVIGQADNGINFLKLLDKYKPDVVFMDIMMPLMDGIEATRKGIEKQPSIKIIALSMQSEEEYLEQMLEAGAMGFLLKNVTEMDVEKAINSVLAGKRFFSEELIDVLTKKFLKKPEITERRPDIFNKNELEIINLICGGFNNFQIGEKLFLSNRTIDGYRSKMLDKIGAVNSVGLVVYAIKNRLVTI